MAVELVRGVVGVTVGDAEEPRAVVAPPAPTQDTVGVTSVFTAIASVTPSASVSRRAVIGAFVFVLDPLPDASRHIAQTLLGVSSTL